MRQTKCLLSALTTLRSHACRSESSYFTCLDYSTEQTMLQMNWMSFSGSWGSKSTRSGSFLAVNKYLWNLLNRFFVHWIAQDSKIVVSAFGLKATGAHPMLRRKRSHEYHILK
uniref:AlNc14C3G450 protein n=1 Tax=Albugo laibachii Nc14 TaxID=890382 RepID=F0VZX2_9STRA|nr:AlNc14C3G450 [Albugo laibachii Nc14]|eukprot:CCA14343.1 AlNc14C3G450 [Albugo laibachii Nc14]